MYFCNFLHLKRAIFPLLVLEIRHILENTKKKHFYLKLDSENWFGPVTFAKFSKFESLISKTEKDSIMWN
jgi:hypothetical protein